MSERGVPERPEEAQVDAAEWQRYYERFGHARYRRAVRLLSRLPSEPRCEACGSPFAGAAGWLLRRAGKAPSRKNPRWCRLCFEMSPPGGSTLTIGVLFADIRGSTAMAEQRPAGEVVDLLNGFYRAATRVIIRHGLVDKLIGDEVMGLYIPPLSPGGRFVEAMVADAGELLRSIGYGTEAGPLVEVGVGLDVGPAFVGHVGEGDVTDFTAIGDVVNTAARLQAEAAGGQIVLPDEVARRAGVGDDEGSCVELDLKGKAEPLAARVLTIGSGPDR